ncbi:hypothetical protein [Proteus mirabilis]|uniref:hypothetical protein n=1 Tax=Proteus mirabilis TaxID=584 RepID=UPI000F5BB8ED|nr:hypothetical protein [Proteus mirabilis]MBS3827949.1 hypothetical protein [Proteus mirabilis]MBS3838764.1 hypothetical protein [Proteus mirabilis]MDC9787894.1 hypothetical protein [Proteus mirabilis]RQW15061.1 hypothetical protein EHQ54_11790 [Proteus mirabilis]
MIMNHNEDLLKLIGYLTDSEIKNDDGLAIIECDLDSDSFSKYVELLVRFGIKEIDSCESSQIIFSLQSSNFKSDTCIYSSIDSFWFKCSNSGEYNPNYIILNEKIFFNSTDDDSVKKICLFLQWKKILATVANHSVDSKYILYIPNNDGGKELVVSCHDLLDSVLSLDFSSDSQYASNQLLKILSLQDAQQKERISILRSAIYDMANQNDDESKVGDIFYLISKGKKVYDRYNDLLDLYTKRFSVNKILSELEQKQLEYTTKINDFVSSSQNKAFAIPGALIAVGGLAKSGGFWDSVLIFIGLYLIYKVTYISNEILSDSYDSLKNSLDNLIKRYSKFDEGVEVRSTASKIDIDIKRKISKAETRIKKINSMGIAMLWIGAIYLFIKWWWGV